MTDLARLPDADLIALYRHEKEVSDWCFVEWVRTVDRVNEARAEIRRRGLDTPSAEVRAATDALPHEEPRSSVGTDDEVSAILVSAEETHEMARHLERFGECDSQPCAEAQELAARHHAELEPVVCRVAVLPEEDIPF